MSIYTEGDECDIIEPLSQYIIMRMRDTPKCIIIICARCIGTRFTLQTNVWTFWMKNK